MPPRSLPLLAACAALLLAGCTTVAPTGSTTPATSTGAAAPTTPPPDMRPATIRGSEESSTLLDNFTAFITAVDGVNVAAGRKGWSQPIGLPPGRHRLAVEFNRGVFLARSELVLDAQPGAAYELRQASDAQVYGGHSYCEFWIIDLATGEKAVPATRSGLSSVKTGG